MSAPDQIGSALAGPVPDVAEPIRGFRRWKWDLHGLMSFDDVRWPVGEPLQASCRSPRLTMSPSWRLYGVPSSIIGYPSPRITHMCPWDPHREPTAHDTHGCGIYAYSTIEGAWANLHGLDPDREVLGEVELWGKVWPHERGYRGEFGRPVVLYRPRKPHPTIWGDPVDALARMYGCEVRDLPLDEEAGDKIAAEAQQQERDAYMQAVRRSVQSANSIRATYAMPPLSSGFIWTENDAPDEVEAKPARRRRSKLAFANYAVWCGWSTTWGALAIAHGLVWIAAVHGAVVGANAYFIRRWWRRG